MEDKELNILKLKAELFELILQRDIIINTIQSRLLELQKLQDIKIPEVNPV